tara:strand:- start:339 stop:698 length:360 start_codon:yes stop_codon:yes gene_type:complete
MNNNTTDKDFDQPLEADQRNLALLVYILQGLGFVTGGLTWIAAMMINYIKLDSVRDTWLESHFRWQLNTFWYGLLWWIVGLVLWLLLLGWLVWGLLSLWALYRIVRGALLLNDNKPIRF